MKVSFSFCAELVGFFISLLFFIKKSDKNYLNIFPYFLLITLIVESIGQVLYDKKTNNLWLYNFFSVFEFVFYLWVIGEIIRNKKAKKACSVLMIAYPICAVMNILFIQKINNYHSYTYTIGCLLIVTSCGYYFLELFLMPHSVGLFKQPAFWICTGLLFFYALTFPIFGLTNFVSRLPKKIIKNLANVISILNIFLYSMFSIAFLCRIRMPKLSRS